ncbi:DnaJ domain [Dillenia turbinata]|uniref:DnaJ domain n=1 Tax=Dillenia turbinata TaxID=194707 RepID=A0AAN8YU55_9MAGN
MGSAERSHCWNVYDDMKTVPTNPDWLMADINAAIATLEYAEVTTFLNSPFASFADPGPIAIEQQFTMLLRTGHIQKTYYDILCVEEDASYDKIRASYKSAILNTHPDKLQTSESSADSASGDRFLEVQKAWEVLSNSRLRAIYDCELRASRRDVITAEHVTLEDMTVEVAGEVLELLHECRCGDYFSVDSLELEEMGYKLLKCEDKISVLSTNARPLSLILPCSSCSLKVQLVINSNKDVYCPL